MTRNQRGTLFVVLAAVSWSFGGVFVKSIPWSAVSITGLRAVFAAVMLAMVRGGAKVKLTRGTLLGALGTGANCLLYVMAAKLTTAANAIVLQYAMPVFVIALCWIFDHRRPGAVDLCCAAAALAGVALCSWEGLSGGRFLGDFLAILAALAFSLVFFCSRLPGASALDYTYLGSALCIPLALGALGDPNMTLQPAHWLSVVGMAACLAGGYFFISLGMRDVSPVRAAILSNLEPVLNPFWVFLFVGERPGALALAGAALVLAAATVYSLLGGRKGERG